MSLYILDILILLTLGFSLCCSVLESVYTVWVQSAKADVQHSRKVFLFQWPESKETASPRMGAWSQAAFISPTSHSFKSTKCKFKVEWRVLASGGIILNIPITFSMHACTWLDSESSSFNYMFSLQLIWVKEAESRDSPCREAPEINYYYSQL